MKIESIAELIEHVGNLDEVGTGELEKVTAAVAAGHGDGKLVIEIKVSLTKSGALHVEPKIKGRVPVAGVMPVLLFRDDDGALVDEDPRQRNLFANGKGKGGSVVKFQIVDPSPDKE